MRLSSIKLSGFKSFVDPTSINLPGSLIGIVGPNGCGKSNTIDAVRWVMGESSAKHLRGESMDDVIFTGSSSRKPVGMASVELVFDNTDGAAGGEYAGYAEIAIRREVTREGTSKYFLNNSRCRRRDIKDIFLGTGLGPRSYAIIEQGMISRLIEAKPEEMRVYLEEAAGISKYKERRRETENRIRHTRDNLDRLDDLREEVDKQIAHLKRQANTAERYQVLKEEERTRKGELLALRWGDYQQGLSGSDESISSKEVELEEIVAELRAAEASIEQERQLQVEATEQFNQSQANYYKLGSEVSRAEQQIAHTRESREQKSTELEQVERSLAEAREHIEQDTRRIEEIDRSMGDDLPVYDQLKESQKISAEMLAQAEKKLQEWQVRWDAHSERQTEQAQIAQLELSRMDQLERGISQSESRAKRLEDELGSLGIESLTAEIEQWIADEVAITAEEARLQKGVENQAGELQQIREAHQSTAEELNSKRGEAQTLIGKLSSLEALQQAALGQQDQAANRWLQDYKLVEKPRLAHSIRVEAGWDKAVELVLGDHLEAICVDDFSALQQAIDSIGNSGITLLDGRQSSTAAGAAAGAATLLGRKVTADVPLEGLLDGVHVAETLAEALSLRESLSAGESVVTKDGLWLGQNWLRTGKTDENDSVLQREQDIKKARSELKQSEQEIVVLQQRLENLNAKLGEHETRRETAQASFNQVLREVSEIKSNLVGGRQKLEQSHNRQARLQSEIEEVRQIREQDAESVLMAKEKRADALEAMEALEQDAAVLREEQNTLQAELERTRASAEQDRDAGQELAIKVESMRSSREATAQNLQRMQAQIEQFSDRQQQLTLALAEDDDDPLIALEASLDGLLSAHLASEGTLASARESLEKVDQRLRSHEQSRVKHENRSNAARETIQQLRLESQEARVRLKTIEEQMAEAGYDKAELMQALPQEAVLEEWVSLVENIERKIQRLGPINLAAIDEYHEQVKRKEYLDSQHEDVVDALATLEAAIAKIDKETKTRFKDTFDRVNAKVEEFFPRLFGGGQARLEMTGDDLLNAGVSVMAQPPGKKITSNQLLSGGEKALTAVALVFAFFELNPSPFCMLDEVDAPLDDANVGRFCALVKDMSSRVQFIFITHNKITMELSQQLMGVTMNEPGVSRLVAVDVDQAVELTGV